MGNFYSENQNIATSKADVTFKGATTIAKSHAGVGVFLTRELTQAISILIF